MFVIASVLYRPRSARILHAAGVTGTKPPALQRSMLVLLESLSSLLSVDSGADSYLHSGGTETVTKGSVFICCVLGYALLNQKVLTRSLPQLRLWAGQAAARSLA